MRCFGGEMTKVRGVSEIIEADISDESAAVLRRSVEKLVACNRQLPNVDYVLLYHDGSLVDRLPGSCSKFTVHEYKKCLKKPYHKIKLYICPEDEYKSCE